MNGRLLLGVDIGGTKCAVILGLSHVGGIEVYQGLVVTVAGIKKQK